MLAMKLRAARPGRDTDDIRHLLPLCKIESIDAAEELYESFYPGDVLSDRAVAQVPNILSEEPASPSIGVPPIAL